MKILYIVPSPPPEIPGTDGLFTEIGYLLGSFDGTVISLLPVRSLPGFIPVRFYGLRHLPALKRLAAGVDVIHVIFPYPVSFWILRHFSGNIVFTVTSGVDPGTLPSAPLPYSFVVSSKSESRILDSNGYTRIHIIPPGIDPSRFLSVPAAPQGGEFVLLAGSAPWVKSQFSSKGFDHLLEVLSRIPGVRLICLFRGALFEEWCQKVREAGLSDRVETVNEKVDVAQVMARCHAAVVLASRSDLVKSYPNSLMEALAAGRPVIVSRAIPISEYVESTGSGIVIEKLSADLLTNAVEGLMKRYHEYKVAVENIPHSSLSADEMIERYRELYGKIVHDMGDEREKPS